MTGGGSGFRKYEEMGAYHWEWADPSSPRYAPAAEARYRLVAEAVAGAGRVLDVGCGDGFLLGRVTPEAGLAVGIDREWSGVALAATKTAGLDRCAVLVGDGLRLPLDDGSVDAVVLCDVIEHLEGPGAAVEECRRVLREGGRLVVTTPRRLPDHWWDRRNHVREYASDELRDLLAGHFERVEMTHFLSLRWWALRKRLGKVFIRLWSRLLFNPFVRSGDEPEGFGHLLATCTKRARGRGDGRAPSR